MSSQSRAASTCSLCDKSSGCPECGELRYISRQFDALGIRQAAVLARVNARRDPVTSKLPTEIVQSIFDIYVKLHQVNPPPNYLPLSNEMYVGIPQFFDTFHRGAPLRLGAVCRRWRDIAWSYPILWSSLLLKIDFPGHLHSPTLVTEWLTRSGTLPLDIKLEGALHLEDDSVYFQDDNNCYDTGSAVVGAINEVSSRWRSLDFIGANSLFAADLTPAGGRTSPDLPGLRHFAANRHNLILATSDPFLSGAIPKFSPTHIALDVLQEDPDSLDNFNLSNLTHLHLSRCDGSALWTLIKAISQSQAPILHLAAHQVDYLDDDTIDDNTSSRMLITLPSLHSMSLIVNEPAFNCATPLIRCLKLPSLRNFHCNTDDIMSSTVLGDLVQRSGCTIHHLILDEAINSERALSPVLDSQPDLTKLTISFRYNGPTVTASWLLMRLSRQNSPNAEGVLFLPSLRHLHVTSFSTDRTQWLSLLNGSDTTMDSDSGPLRRRGRLESVEFVQRF